MQTENLGVVYYVKKDFKNEYKGASLQKLEKSVEEDYVSNIRNNCWKERQQSKLNSLTGVQFFSYKKGIEILYYSGEKGQFIPSSNDENSRKMKASKVGKPYTSFR